MVSEKLATIGSILLFVILLIPIVVPSSAAAGEKFDWLYSVALLFPLVMGAWGILMAKYGPSGILKIALMVGHIGLLTFYVYTFISGLI